MPPLRVSCELTPMFPFIWQCYAQVVSEVLFPFFLGASLERCQPSLQAAEAWEALHRLFYFFCTFETENGLGHPGRLEAPIHLLAFRMSDRLKTPSRAHGSRQLLLRVLWMHCRRLVAKKVPAFLRPAVWHSKERSCVCRVV